MDKKRKLRIPGGKTERKDREKGEGINEWIWEKRQRYGDT